MWVLWSVPLYACICLVSHAMAPTTVGPIYFSIRKRYNMLMSGMSASFFLYTLFYYSVAVNEYTTRLVTQLWIISKVLEWADTVFLLIKKSPVRVLHFWHHISTVALFSMAAGDRSMSSLAMMLNSGVHAIMYRHYATPLQSWVVPYITKAQMLQFLIILIYGCYTMRTPATHITRTQQYSCMVIVGSYLVLFARFYYLRWLRLPTV